MLAIPSINAQVAVEIQLTPIYGLDVLPGDNPFDGPVQSGDNPTHPNEFTATLEGNILTVLNESVDMAILVVTDLLSEVVVENSRFTDEESIVLPTGEYQLEIITPTFILEGLFEVE